MNQYLKNMGLGLAGKLIDFGVASLTGPHRPRPEQRIEQIDKTLQALESAPADGQHWTPPLVETPRSQKEASLAPAATTSHSNSREKSRCCDRAVSRGISSDILPRGSG